ncbi:MAG: BMP family ABC transporter substrate-binding protein, partial [Oscillospiraceae bacterium]|nr:BMP family ABC transporter substrate-binding protein [Oscillospiraceae bacterium]
MKKILALLLALTMIFALAACGKKAEPAPAPAAEAALAAEAAPAAKAAPFAGLICLHDENSGYDANFINGFVAACEALGVEYSIKKNIDDSNTEGYDAACELADDGCKVVFSDSYGHGSYLLQAAQEIPEVHFTSCT